MNKTPVTITFRAPASWRDRLDKLAADEAVGRSEIARQLMREALDRAEGQKAAA